MASTFETSSPLSDGDKQAFMLKNLQQKQEKFIESLEGRLDDIAESWVQLLEVNNDLEALEKLHRDLHSLTGTAGTYSLSELSQKARELEVFFKGLTLKEDFELNHETEVQASSMLQDLISIAQHQEPVQMQPATVNSVHKMNDENPRILLVEDDRDVIDLLTRQFEYFGYEVKSVMDLALLEAVYNEFRPSLIISEISFPIDHLAGVNALKDIHSHQKIDVPIIFLSVRLDMEARLSAIRMGSSAYISKPIHLSVLMDKVTELTDRHTVEPPRVLIVDDDIGLTQFMTVVLENSGMAVKAINDPLTTLDILSEFMPDIVLMDYLMPGCNGIELSQVIRQDPTFTSLPILFLSGESDENLQLTAMIEGGDDLITKPIKADVLSSVVAAKARRARQLAALIITDGLTGLFNHSYIEYLLEQETERAERSQTNFSVIMLDIDHFKKVNDAYGHTSGDAVLRSLSYLLKNRLRHTDLIGRFGGEEFLILMPDTAYPEAEQTLNLIRNVFAQTVHTSQESAKAFKVTFSAGIADFNMADSTEKGALLDYADQALYQAKESGRNQVVIYQESMKDGKK